ncbi:helicase C-terminal domain-containing protein [Adlercreutzia sp. ZJ304]|uniref:helicase C-terminal domain-containing protein n=1 Tax=Adlercreutzia sp. ZJ304 TaxID=2709791 RepID=UPI0013EA6E27|nr:helicase C-terminal domain-containing protein [Adlercreutzia sp. ZJ304]
MPHKIAKFILDGTSPAIIERYASLIANAENADYGEFDRNIVVIDTETTGISVRKDELTQIAAARIEHGIITDWYITFVNPGMPIPDEVAHLTNIHDSDVEGAPDPQTALAGLVEFVGDAKLVAHNAAFDRSFTTKHPAGYPLLENIWIDSLELARIALPRMKSHRLIDLVRAFDAPLSTHRADEDVAATYALYRLLLAAVEAMPASLVREIAQLAPPTEWPTGIVFAYFANKAQKNNLQNKNTPSPANSTTLNIGEANDESPHIEPFSLKQERQNVARKMGKAKNDAATMISAELAQRAGINVPEVLEFPTKNEIDEAFSETGIIGTIFEDYHQRDEQLQMAQAVRTAFATSDNLVVEAGTGVGKSMAYLVPAALTALQNNINVGIATKSNALLDQLIYHELPALSESLQKTTGKTLTYAPLKGFTHYPCLRKVERIMREGARMVAVQGEEHTQAPAIAALLSFIQQTEYDDMDSLKIDYRLLPRRTITTTSHDCMRRKCPFFGAACFVHGQRRKAEASDIVVTNHSLFFCDIAADHGLLPPIRYWVIDEAHSAEMEARRALSLELAVDALNNLAARVSAEESARNVFVRAERNVIGPANTGENMSATAAAEASQADFGTLFYALTSKAKDAGRKFSQAESEFASHVRDLLYFDTQKKSSYEYVDLWINEEMRRSEVFQSLIAMAQILIDASEKLVNVCQELVGYMEDAQGAAVVQREIASVAYELKDVITAADAIFVHPSETYVYSANLARKHDRGGSTITAQLYNVGAKLDETLYVDTHSVVFTSATLTVADSFRPFMEAMGLNTSPQSQAKTLALGSTYDFDSNMTIYVPNDLPDPTATAYIPQLCELLKELHVAQGGSMLTLFTNRKEMDTCFAEVAPHLKTADLRLVCQRWGVSVKGLRDDFLSDETLSLFALKSFWEGFDAPGSTLRGVVLPKLPFSKPSDPLSCERSARDDAAWRKWVLPQAVLEVKQAVGRLIRKAEDEGIVVLADTRLLSKGYGKVFLKSMPSCDVRIMPTAEIIKEIAVRNR